jgi:hypothetical protein
MLHLGRMDDRNDRMQDLIESKPEPDAVHAPVKRGKPEWCAHVPPDCDDPVLRALAAAPYVPVSDEENAFLDEIERTCTERIPHKEFLAMVGLTEGVY